jgi:hypothetical protein
MSLSLRRSSRGSRRRCGTPLQKSGQADRRLLRLEPLEDRRLMAVFTVSNLADAGAGSLRAAISAANGAAGADTIDFSVTGTIPLASQLPTITQELHIDGPGARLLTIDTGGGGVFSTLLIDDGNLASEFDVSMSGLTLTGSHNGSSRGAIANDENLAILSCVIRDNTGAGTGAGIHNRGTLVLRDSTLSGNVGDYGGGIANYGSVEVVNSTLSGNRANEAGGGIISSGPLTIAHSTLSGNQGGSGGGILHGFATLSLMHSIVANSLSGDDIYFAPSATVQGSHNLVEDGSDGLSDTIVGDPLLGPLADNGGPTDTHALLYGSPAFDAGDPGAIAGAGGVPEFDGRGAPFGRVVGRIDVGAVEAGQMVDTLVDESDGDFSAGDLSLREAIERLNADPSLFRIGFDPTLTGGGTSSPATIALTMGGLQISDSAVIVGPGADRLIIDASGNDPTPAANDGNGSRVFIVNDGNGTADKEVLISGLTLTGGDVDSSGGGIANGEILTLRESVIAGNAATLHGGAVNDTGVSVVERSTLSGNFAALGGAVANGGQTTISDSTISGNSATVRGGGVYNFASGGLTIARSTITENSAGQLGGGLSALGNVSVSSSIIAENEAPNFENVFGTLASDSNNMLSGDPLLGPLADNGGPTPTHALLPGSPALDAALTPLYNYPLNENFEDALALGADLVPLGGALTGEAYNFGANQGLQTQIPATEATDYSLELWFKLDNVSASSGYQKLVDFSTPANPSAGLYVFNNRLRYVVDAVTGFYTGTQILTANAMHHVVLTRSGGPTVEINAYVDGAFDKNYPESFGGHTLAAFSEPGGSGDARVVRLFRSQNGFGPPGAGAVDRIRFYDHALGAAEVTEAFATAPLPDFDQRGTPFARQAGDGVDIGAYELQSTLAADFNSDGNVDGADFLAWQRGLGKPNAVPADGDSDGDADVDAADLAAWRAAFGQVGATPALAASEASKEPDSLAGATSASQAELVDAAMALADLPLNVDESESPGPVKPVLTPVFVKEGLASSLTFPATVTRDQDPLRESSQRTSTDELAWLSEELLAAVFS